jgi:hypothetical protein
MQSEIPYIHLIVVISLRDISGVACALGEQAQGSTMLSTFVCFRLPANLNMDQPRSLFSCFPQSGQCQVSHRGWLSIVLLVECW